MFSFSQEMRSDQAALIPPASGGGGRDSQGLAASPRGRAAGGWCSSFEKGGALGRRPLNPSLLPISPNFP